MFRKEIKGSGKYNEIISILKKISTRNVHQYPLYTPYTDNHGMTRYRISGELVRKEAEILLNILQTEEKIGEIRFNFLPHYLCSETNMMLHNYAVSLSHNKQPRDSMDTIRSWLIIENLVSCWSTTIDQSGDWTIPDGWKKEMD